MAAVFGRSCGLSSPSLPPWNGVGTWNKRGVIVEVGGRGEERRLVNG